MKKLTTLLALFITISSFSQSITGNELLEKAIQFHDPNGNWNTFKGDFFVTMETPNNGVRKSKITIDLPNQYFSVHAKKDTISTAFIVDKEICSFSLNGKQNLSAEKKKKYSLNCERANLYKNYYTYLYGLPMKLKD